jgi:conjugal transfer pilus assembly protein TraW
MGLLAPALSQAQSLEDKAIRDQAQAIAQRAAVAERPAWLGPPDAIHLQAAQAAGGALGADAMVRAEAQATETPGAQPAPGTPLSPNDIRMTVLVSTSLGEGQLRDIFAFASQTPGTQVVFRGVKPKQPLMAFIRDLETLVVKLDPIPVLQIDPTPFHGETRAPVMIAEGPQGELARVAGLADPQWLRAQVLAGQRGDLGVRGPVRSVVEPDLIEELQGRLASLDLGALRDKAAGRYWQRVAFEDLPVAGRTRERTIDPTVVANADVRDVQGNLIVAAGTRTNPLDLVPFTQRLVVFDGADPRQITTAQHLGQLARPGQRVTYIVTGLDRRAGWEGLQAVENRLDAPVYLLTADVRQRFALERVPALVEAKDRMFAVTEIPPQEAP